MKSKPYLIGITGGSGSGKTSFIRNIRKVFSEEEVCIVSQDDYYVPREQQKKDERGEINFDLPESIDEKALQEDIEKLIKGQTISRDEYTFNNEKKESRKLTIKPAPIIIVEGIFVLYFEGIKSKLDLKVFLHAKEILKIIRRINRDREERNYPIDDVLYRYQYHVLPTFEKYILPCKEDAHIVINNNESFENGLDVFIGFLKQKVEALKVDF